MSQPSKGARRVSAVPLLEASSRSAEPGTLRHSKSGAVPRLACLPQTAAPLTVGKAMKPPYHQSTSYREVDHPKTSPASTPQVHAHLEHPLRPAKATPMAVKPVKDNQPRDVISSLNSEPSFYFAMFLTGCIALPVLLIVVYSAVVLSLGGDFEKIPRAVEGMSQAIVQGVRCGWDVDVPDDGWGCFPSRMPTTTR